MVLLKLKRWCFIIPYGNGSKLDKTISLEEQIDKFGLGAYYINFNQVIAFGLGYHLGIFDYLEEKGKSSSNKNKITSVTFTFDELLDNLKLNRNYLKAWLKLSSALGIFEPNRKNIRFIKTSPHIYDLLINSESQYLLRSAYMFNYQFTILQNDIIANFKKGGVLKRQDGDLCEKAGLEGQKFSAFFGLQRLTNFNNRFKDFKEYLAKDGFILEIGCGYGFNLENIGKMYKNARIIGIDVNLKGTKNAQKIVEKHGWQDRIEVYNVSINKYATPKLANTFDLILLNEVLHELNTDEIQRINMVNNLYNLLKDDGILIVGERMVPDMLEIESKGIRGVFRSISNWNEVCFGARPYTEKIFKTFISSIHFNEKKIERLREGDISLWVLRK